MSNLVDVRNVLQRCMLDEPFKDEIWSILFKDSIRTAQ